jgi:hypothetical protein
MRSASALSTSYPRLFRMAAAHAVCGYCSEMKDAVSGGDGATLSV